MATSRTISCPACRSERPLVRAEADAHLVSLRCESCGGQWIRGELYYAWLDRGDRQGDAQPPAEMGEVQDSTRAKLCPECGKIMRRYAVGKGLGFAIDRCGTCAGIWFDANEWESLQRAGLADQVHFVFSTAWQSEILRVEQARQSAERLRDKVGQEDYQRLQSLADWIEQHPHRVELAAYLVDRLRDAPPKR